MIARLHRKEKKIIKSKTCRSCLCYLCIHFNLFYKKIHIQQLLKRIIWKVNKKTRHYVPNCQKEDTERKRIKQNIKLNFTLTLSEVAIYISIGVKTTRTGRSYLFLLLLQPWLTSFVGMLFLIKIVRSHSSISQNSRRSALGYLPYFSRWFLIQALFKMFFAILSNESTSETKFLLYKNSRLVLKTTKKR